MIVIGVQELEEHIGEVLRRVREQGETVEVVEDGEVVAHLLPPPPRPGRRSDAEVLADMDRLATVISAHWPPGVSALDAVHDVRRDL